MKEHKTRCCYSSMPRTWFSKNCIFPSSLLFDFGPLPAAGHSQVTGVNFHKISFFTGCRLLIRMLFPWCHAGLHFILSPARYYFPDVKSKWTMFPLSPLAGQFLMIFLACVRKRDSFPQQAPVKPLPLPSAIWWYLESWLGFPTHHTSLRSRKTFLYIVTCFSRFPMTPSPSWWGRDKKSMYLIPEVSRMGGLIFWMAITIYIAGHQKCLVRTKRFNEVDMKAAYLSGTTTVITTG